MIQSVTSVPIILSPDRPPSSGQDVTRLRDLSPQQWKSGVAAWLGWLFDGLDMQLYVLVAAPFVAELLGAASAKDPAGGLLQLLDPGGVSVRLGAGGRLLRIDRGSPWAQPRLDVDDPHVRVLYRTVVLRANLVALAHLSIPGGLGDRR